MLKARDIMTSDVISVKPDTPISEVAGLLLDNHINGAPVIDENGHILGIICQSDLIAQQKKLPLPSVFTLLDTFIPIYSRDKLDKEIRKISAVNAAQAMTPNPTSVNPEANLEDIAELMVSKGFHTIPVVEEGKLVGIIGKEDILRTILPA
ncbi:MAG: CBS domain-containing protein [Syntrophobacteraceae bacterium]